ncbi:MAG: MbtH domain protein [Rickettsiales bacterium]|nr:MAG: MbtH domain protein [Rickettsiales bacterium]
MLLRYFMNELIEKLSIGKHPIAFELKSRKIHEIKHRLIELKFVSIKFINTKGGTELGINIEDQFTCFNNANFDECRGNIHVVGWCILNYYKVRCTADIDLATKEGIGYLELLNEVENVIFTTRH